MAERGFRLLLLTHLVVLLTSEVIGNTAAGLLPEALIEAEAAAVSVNAEAREWTWPLTVALGLAVIASYIGLFRLRPWGRTLAVVTTAAVFGLSPFFPPTVASGVQSAVYDLSNMLWGAVLALTYIGPLSTRFGPRNSSRPAPLGGAA